MKINDKFLSLNMAGFCAICKHRQGFDGYCLAFPMGIPDKYWEKGEYHGPKDAGIRGIFFEKIIEIRFEPVEDAD